MASIPVNDLRQGVVFQQLGKHFEVLAFSHHKMARGKAIVNVKVRDLRAGNVNELTFRGRETVELVETRRVNLEFVYFDKRKGEVVFQDPNDRKRWSLKLEAVNKEDLNYLSEGTAVVATFIEDSIVSVDLPATVELRVTMAPPSDKGDTATGGSKPVEVETGATLNTPFFIKEGDVIKVNTKTGEYVGRV